MLVLDAPKGRFEFEIGGKQYSVPHMDDIPYDTVKGLREAKTNAEAVEWIIANVFEAEAPEAMRGITNGQMKALLNAYLDEAGATPGESLA